MIVPSASPWRSGSSRTHGDGHSHRVQFYESEEFLANVVSDFLHDGLRAGEPALVVATDEHRHAFWAGLEARGLDVARACGDGRLVALDARDVARELVVDGVADAGRFATHVGGAVAACRAGADRPLRVFGEIVDVLWRDGRASAAIRVEELWNELERLHPFSLLCAYAMAGFYRETQAKAFERVCDVHGQVLPAETFPAGDLDDPRSRELARLQQRARALESEIERRKELEAALRDALEERRRTVDFAEKFVAILGHDLRNPLQTVTAAAMLLADRAGPGEIATLAGRALRSSRRMARMIDQVLDLTRIRLGHGIPLSRRRMDLVELCRSSVDDIAAAERARVRLEVRGDACGTWDGDRLAQLVSNLLANALAHGARTEPVEISVDGSDRALVVLEVRNGGAIRHGVLDALFEPFARGPAVSADPPGGLGLGLYISRQVVLAHSGSIDVTSSEEEGTRFAVRLPRSPSPGARAAAFVPLG